MSSLRWAGNGQCRVLEYEAGRPGDVEPELFGLHTEVGAVNKRTADNIGSPFAEGDMGRARTIVQEMKEVSKRPGIDFKRFILKIWVVIFICPIGFQSFMRS